MRPILCALAMSALIAAPAMAQTTSPAPAPAKVDANAPLPGANSFTEGQAKSRIEGAGFTGVTGLAKGEDGVWRGQAMKAGASVKVAVDYRGNVTVIQ